MAKIKQRNWLLLITFVLVLSSLGILFAMLQRNLGIGFCVYEGVEYSVNDPVPEYSGGEDCVCSNSGEIVCNGEELSMSYEDFANEEMVFTYSFRNYLDKDQPDLVGAELVDIQYKEGLLRVVMERESLCGDFNEAPVQAGMYKLEEEEIVFTAITNRDESMYSRVCLIGNTFEIQNVSIADKPRFSVSYQNDQGNMTNFRICLANGNIYSNGDVFKDSESNSICTCLGPEVECEEL
ncbi:MAG: hypothetical protein WCY37_02370 [Candidatus Dojkabacteria bacterium]